MTSAAPSSGFPRLEKYELLEEIGHGGMATVYRARDPRLNREVAVKVIHKHLRENSEVATRFVAEARAAAKLRHGGIVEVFDVSNEEDPERYLVVELIKGTTLRKILLAHRDMPAEVGAAIVLEICAGIEHAHEQGIIHRDIKPENVLVELPGDRAAWALKDTSIPPAIAKVEEDPKTIGTASGEIQRELSPSDTQKSPIELAAASSQPPKPKKAKKKSERPERVKLVDDAVVIKITDFGIAKILDAQGVTSTGQVLGSPAHMAPEQIDGGDVDARTDVFALGVLMYECLVGHLPFEGRNPAQVLRKVLECQYPVAERERPTVGGRWSKIIDQALAREVDERIKGPSELAALIRAELLALGITDPHAEVVRYFADPKAYAATLPNKLIAKLVARGESARKTDDIPGAAADFNRAVALAPNDPSILRRLTNLNSSRSRRELVKRAALILGGSAILGLSAFGIARALKHRPTAPIAPTAIAIGPTSAPTSSAAAAPSAIPSVAASAVEPAHSIKPPVPVVVATPPTNAAAASSPRKVRFAFVPQGARLLFDGAVVTSGDARDVAPGTHTYDLSSSPCCKTKTGSFVVTAPPADNSEEVQIFNERLEYLPATVVFTGPATSTVTCTGAHFFMSVGESRSVLLSTPIWNGHCEFVGPKGEKARGPVTLKAGEVSTIAYPG